MNNLNKILVALLVLQFGLVGFAFWPGSTAQAVDSPLLAGFDTTSVTQLTIEDSDGNTVVLAAQDDETWVIPNRGDFPVEADKIPELLAKFEDVKTNRLLTQTEASHKRLQVATDDFNRRVEIKFADGSEQEIFVGSSAGAGATHLRLAEQGEVYLTNALNAFEINAAHSSWIDTLYHDVSSEDAVALTLTNENGTFSFIKIDESWELQDLTEGEVLKESAVSTLLNQTTSIRMTEPLSQREDAEYGFDEPLATVTIKTEGEDGSHTYTFTIGSQNYDESGYIAKSSESPYYVEISEFNANNLLNKARADFLEEVEEVEESP